MASKISGGVSDHDRHQGIAAYDIFLILWNMLVSSVKNARSK